jgi:hypothetical protein
MLLDWLVENRDLVGKKSRIELARAAYNDTVLMQDTDVTATKVGIKIDALRVSFRGVLGFDNQTGAGTTLDGTSLRDKQLEEFPHFNRCVEVWGGKSNITPLAPKDTLASNPAKAPIVQPLVPEDSARTGTSGSEKFTSSDIGM